MDTHSAKCRDNNEWISTLLSTIEFLKSDIHQKNLQINQLLSIISQSLVDKIRSPPLSNDISESIKKNDAISCDLAVKDSETIINSRLLNVDESNITFRKSRSKEAATSDNSNIEDASTKPRIEVVGDSILNNINGIGISKYGNVKVLPYPGATSEDLKDHVQPSLRRRPDALILHIGTNDITKGIDTIANLQTIVSRVRRRSSNTRLTVSSVLIRHDQPNIEFKVKKLNADLQSFCDENRVAFLSNGNIDDTCLGKGQLHPNKKGKAFLAKNLINFINDAMT